MDKASKHSFALCLDAVAKSDYFVLLIRNRYGRPVVSHNRSKISITHCEYREAQRLNIPRFIMVDSRTWDAKHMYDSGKPQSYVAEPQSRVFGLIDEIRKRKRGNWLDIFASRHDLSTTISSVPRCRLTTIRCL